MATTFGVITIILNVIYILIQKYEIIELKEKLINEKTN